VKSAEGNLDRGLTGKAVTVSVDVATEGSS
jgi:hypothetical protein